MSSNLEEQLNNSLFLINFLESYHIQQEPNDIFVYFCQIHMIIENKCWWVITQQKLCESVMVFDDRDISSIYAQVPFHTDMISG